MNSDPIHERLDYLNQENENIKLVLSQILQNQFIQNPNICLEIYQDVDKISKNVNETNKIMKLDYKDLNKEIRQEWKDLKKSQDEFLKTTSFVTNLAQSALTEIDVLFDKRKRQIDEYFAERKKKYERLETKAKGFQTMYQTDLKELVEANNSDRALRESSRNEIVEFRNNQNEMKDKLMKSEAGNLARLAVLEQRINDMEGKTSNPFGGSIAAQPIQGSSIEGERSVPNLEWNRTITNLDATCNQRYPFKLFHSWDCEIPSKKSKSTADMKKSEKIDWKKAGFAMNKNQLFQFGDNPFSKQKQSRWSSGSSSSTNVQSFSYEFYNN